MHKLFVAAGILTATSFAGAAQADSRACCRPIPKWYATIGGGITFLNDSTTDATFTNTGTPFFRDTTSFKPGYTVGGALGYRLLPWLRAEGEIRYINGKPDKNNGVSVAPTASGTEYTGQRTLAFMGNMYYDWRNSSRLTPFIGAGAGEARVKAAGGYTVTNLSTGATESKTVSDWAFAYQFMGGVTYSVGTDYQPIDISLMYRYLKTEDISESMKQLPVNFKMSNGANSIELAGRLYF